MVDIINGVSAIADSAEEYLDLRSKGYSMIYWVEGPTRKFFQKNMLGHIVGELKEGVIPQLRVSNQVPTEVSFLPGGKLDPSILDKVVNFFRAVSDKFGGASTHGEMEAQVHVVWNTISKSYEIRVPTQKVSKASVTSTFDHMLEGDLLVLDIHSHNTMGAFFSSTDDTDDISNNVKNVYCGVIGKITRNSYESKWRFCHQLLRNPVEVQVNDIFSIPSKAAVDPAWLNKVTAHTFHTSKFQHGHPAGFVGHPNRMDTTGFHPSTLARTMSGIGSVTTSSGAPGISTSKYTDKTYSMEENLYLFGDALMFDMQELRACTIGEAPHEGMVEMIDNISWKLFRFLGEDLVERLRSSRLTIKEVLEKAADKESSIHYAIDDVYARDYEELLDDILEDGGKLSSIKKVGLAGSIVRELNRYFPSNIVEESLAAFIGFEETDHSQITHPVREELKC